VVSQVLLDGAQLHDVGTSWMSSSSESITDLLRDGISDSVVVV